MQFPAHSTDAAATRIFGLLIAVLTAEARKVMKRTHLLLTALASLTMATAQDLKPARTEFQWNDWDVKIESLLLKDTCQYARDAGPDSVFVLLNMTVQNIGHDGRAFIPQNDVKIIIGHDAFDAADIDEHWTYSSNIEPTLSRTRYCYFELPKSVVKDSFVIRFSAILTSGMDLPVAIAAPTPTLTPTPDPTSTPAPLWTAPTPTATPEATQEATPEPTPVPRLVTRSEPTKEDMVLVLDVEKALNNHDWQSLTSRTADGEVNYFGRRNTTNDYIRRDMEQDAQTYSSSRTWRYLDTFSRRTSGDMIYDSIHSYSEVQERHGRLHKALCRLTVGYTLHDGIPTIYDLAINVIGNRPE